MGLKQAGVSLEKRKEPPKQPHRRTLGYFPQRKLEAVDHHFHTSLECGKAFWGEHVACL